MWHLAKYVMLAIDITCHMDENTVALNNTKPSKISNSCCHSAHMCSYSMYSLAEQCIKMTPR